MSDRLVDGRFSLLKPLGRGEAGQVWQAVDEQTGGPVAVKLLDGRPGPDPAVRLAHPNIVSIYLTGTHDGVPYVVMELVEGVSLATVLEEGALYKEDAVTVATGVSLALHAAHSAGIVHGNLKPSNVLIADQGIIKVGDFTGRGDPREDMYALGMMMEAMSGSRDPVVDRLLSREPYTPAELHEVLTGRPLPAAAPALVEDDGEPERPKLMRLAIITGVVTLALIIAVCAWFLTPSTPPRMESQTPSGDTPTSPAESTSPEPTVSVTNSTAETTPTHSTGVNAVKAVIANQLKAGQIQPDAASALNDRLDEIGRFLSRGLTKQANDRIAALKAQLAEQRRINKVTADGYNAILAAINKLST